MKKLIALLAVIGFVPSAYAAEGSDISWSGDYRLQYSNVANSDLNDSAADTSNQAWAQRTRLGVSGRAGEKMGFHGTFVHNADWGSNADQVPGGDDATTSNSPFAASEGNTLIVNEAYMTWLMSDALSMKVGRGSATIGNGYVVSANDWEPVAKAFDGAIVSWDHEMVKLSGFGVLGAVGVDGEGDDFGRFYGVNADFKKLPAFLKVANVHYIMVKRDEGDYAITGNTLDKEDSTRIGVTVGGDMMGVDYSATYAQYSGDTTDAANTKTDIDATMMDLEVGYTLANVLGGTRIYAGHHTDSGTKDDGAAGFDKNETYDGFHYETHATAGLMDVFEWGNLTYSRFGVTMSPMEDLSVAAEYLMFTQTEKNPEAGTDTNGTALGGAEDANKDDLGTELDLTVTKKYSNNFAISASYRMFTPGDEYDNATDQLKDGATQMYLEGKLNF